VPTRCARWFVAKTGHWDLQYQRLTEQSRRFRELSLATRGKRSPGRRQASYWRRSCLTEGPTQKGELRQFSLLNTCRRLSSTGPSSESCDQHSSRLFSRLMQDRMTSPRNDGHPKPGTGHRSEQDQILGARPHAESKAGTRAIVVAATVTWRLSRPQLLFGMFTGVQACERSSNESQKESNGPCHVIGMQ
jgi:hypothetical protein